MHVERPKYAFVRCVAGGFGASRSDGVLRAAHGGGVALWCGHRAKISGRIGARYRVSRTVIDSGGSVMRLATDEAGVLPTTILELSAFWFPAL